MTRGQLKTRVSRILGIALGTDDDGVAEAALLEELANEAVIDILSRTRVHVRFASVILNEGDTQFEFDDGILRIFDVSRSGTDPAVPDNLTEGDRTSLGVGEYAWPGFNRIYLGQTAGANDTIFFWYTPAPAPMTTDTDDPSVDQFGRIPTQFHLAIVNYMMWHAADKAGDQGAGRGERYRILYEGRDGMAGPGSNLGTIKTATNLRGSAVRVKRARPVLVGDQFPRHWQG